MIKQESNNDQTRIKQWWNKNQTMIKQESNNDQTRIKQW